MPEPRPRLTGLLLGASALLVLVALLWWNSACSREATPASGSSFPSITVPVTALDIIAAFEQGGPEVRIVTQDEQAPLWCVPAQFEKDATLASDAAHKLIRAHAESAFEVRAGPFLPGAKLIARTLVYTASRNDPEAADPAPVTFRVLVDGEERARLGSEYVRQAADVENPYDQLLRTLEIPLDGGVVAFGCSPAPRTVTLRFETTRFGAAVPPGVVPAEPVWWELRVEQPVAIPRQAASPDRPNILVLMVDTLAARRMSLLGYPRETTPELTAFARGGTSFDRALAPASWTLPSVAALLTGLPANTHGVLGDTRSYLMGGLTTWPEVLQQAGLAGIAVVANPIVARGNHFDQGFTDWIQANNESAEQLDARLLGWLDGQPAGARWFAYVHYMDPHAPYGAPGAARERFTGGYVEQRSFAGLLPGQLQHDEIPPFTPGEQQHVIDLYDGDVAYVDGCIAQLRAALAARGLLEDTLIALVADHGEELFEHGRLGHGYSLYGEQVEVPLVLVGPGVPAGARIAERVGTIGLANTLLSLAHAPLLKGAADPLLPRPAAGSAAPLFATVRTQLFGPRHSLVSATDAQGRRAILALDEQGGLQGAEWFDLSGDPGEAAPRLPDACGAAERQAFEALQKDAQAWFAETAARRPPGEQPRSPEIDQGFEQNGYVGGGR